MSLEAVHHQHSSGISSLPPPFASKEEAMRVLENQISKVLPENYHLALPIFADRIIRIPNPSLREEILTSIVFENRYKKELYTALLKHLCDAIFPEKVGPNFFFSTTEPDLVFKIIMVFVEEVMDTYICKHIDKLGLSDEQLLALIPNLSTSDVIDFFYNFKFKNPDKKIEAIFLILKSNKFFNLFQLIRNMTQELQTMEKGQKIIPEFALQCMRVNPYTTCNYFDEFNIQDEQFKLQIFNSYSDALEFISNFNFSEQTCFDLAMKLPVDKVAANFSRFNIKDPRLRLKVIDRLSQSEDDTWITKFDQLDINDSKECFRLAHIAARQIKFGLAFPLFKICDIEERIALMKEFAKHWFNQFCRFHKKFAIRGNPLFDENLYIEIVKAADIGKKDIFEIVDNLPITNFRALGDQFLTFARGVPELFLQVQRLNGKPSALSNFVNEILNNWIFDFSREKEKLFSILQKYPSPTMERYIDLLAERDDFQLNTDLINFIACCDLLGLSEDARAKYFSVLDQIIIFKQTAIRRPLMVDLLHRIVDEMDPERTELIQRVQKQFKKQEAPNNLFVTLIARFPHIEFNSEFEQAVANLGSKVVSRDKAKHRMIAEALNKLFNITPLKEAEKWKLFTTIFARPTAAEAVESCKTFLAVAGFEKPERFIGIDTVQKLDQLLIDLFKESTGIVHRDNFNKLFHQNIFTERSGAGLCKLGSALKKVTDLRREEMTHIQKHFSQLVDVLLNAETIKQRDERFRQHRFNLRTEHAKIAFKDSHFAQLWTKGAVRKVDFKADEQRGMTPEERINAIRINFSYKDHYKVRLDPVQSCFDAPTKENRQKALKEIHGLGLKPEQIKLATLYIQLSDPQLTAEQAVKLISGELPKLQETLKDEDYQQYLNDLKGILNLSQSKKAFKDATLTFVDSDDPEDLLNCGTEVENSCLELNYGVNAKCVLANMLDFKIRIIAVKDDKGKILARRTVRMLIDRKGEAFLLREPLYQAAGVPNKVLNELDAFVAQRARDLGCTLVSGGLEEGEKSLGTCDVESLGSVVPLEQSDTANDMTGVYKLYGLDIIQMKPTFPDEVLSEKMRSCFRDPPPA